VNYVLQIIVKYVFQIYVNYVIKHIIITNQSVFKIALQLHIHQKLIEHVNYVIIRV
jgi:hypothetical protein